MRIQLFSRLVASNPRIFSLPPLLHTYWRHCFGSFSVHLASFLYLFHYRQYNHLQSLHMTLRHIMSIAGLLYDFVISSLVFLHFWISLPLLWFATSVTGSKISVSSLSVCTLQLRYYTIFHIKVTFLTINMLFKKEMCYLHVCYSTFSWQNHLFFSRESEFKIIYTHNCALRRTIFSSLDPHFGMCSKY